MNDGEDWSEILNDHPIFSLPNSFSGPSAQRESSLELSTSNLTNFTHLDPTQDGPTPSGRRQVMVLKDADLIVASGKEIRITSLGESKLSKSNKKTYKILHTPNVQFEIHQISLNPSGKLLAVAGAFQVAVVVLPRPGFTRLVPATVDCKSVQIGQFYHASSSSAPIAKIEWHPWGEAGSTLLVMTVDGKLREYDISIDPEEPQQVLTFVSPKKNNSYVAEDLAEREVASFTLGKGRADWGPLTLYAVMKSGDIYSICPYMPQNASIPSAYVHALECFISAKQEFLSQSPSSTSESLSVLYDYQHKYVTALVKQLPPGTVFPAPSRSVLMHPPSTIKAHRVRQGPFLLQPSPRIIEGSEGGDATDITYLAFGVDDDADGEGETERLGVVLITYQDGKVDVCLDVEKVEARWENKQHPNSDLPMLAVYETIDLGLVSTLNAITVPPGEPPILDLIQGNHPVFVTDPIHEDTIYVYHAFGVHTLHLGPLLQSVAVALRAEDDDEGASLNVALQQAAGTLVQPILSTFSVERRCSNPVVAVCVPNDVYLTYSISILTSAMRITSFPLNLRSDSPPRSSKELPLDDDIAVDESKSQWLIPVKDTLPRASYIGPETFVPPSILSRPFGLPSNPRLSVPGPSSTDKDQPRFMLTPDTMRYLGTTVAKFTTQINEVLLAGKETDIHVKLQMQEFKSQQTKCKEMFALVEDLKGARHDKTQERVERVQQMQKTLLGRLDRLLQSLMEKASPELSEYETKWFEELKRMKEDIMGAGRYDEGSLAARTKLLEREYARILPSLKVLLEKEAKHAKKLAESNKGLGLSQAFELGERSNMERAKILEVEKKVVRLADRLQVPVGHPPSRQ